jgi:colicin import membrane protein
MQAPRRPAKLPPPPRAELLKQQQEEEERRKAAAAAKLADIERRIALRKEAEAKAAVEAAAAAASAEELAAAAATEGGDAHDAGGLPPAESACDAVSAEQPVSEPAAPSLEPAAPPNAWVKPLTLANGVLDPEHPPSAAMAADDIAAKLAQGQAMPQEVEPVAVEKLPLAGDSTAQEQPRSGGSVAAVVSGQNGDPAEAVRGQRPQRGRGRAKAERLYEPEPMDR